MLKNPEFPSGDDMAASLIKRMRELSLPILNLPREQTVAFFQEQAIWLICQQSEGKSLLADCAIATKMKDKEVFVTLSCPTADIARKLKDYYLAALKRYGKWQQVPTKTLFKFPSCRVPYSISYKFAANSPTLPNESGDPEQSVDESPIQVPQTSELATPQDESEEFIQLTRHSSQPSSILSMRNGKVLDINRLILTNYVNMVYDEVVGMDVTRLFEKRGDRQPDDLNAFHSQLRKDLVIHGSIKAFQSTGAFSITFGTFYHRVIWGINCRQSFFEGAPQLLA
jgi:hypothetical protein